MQTDFSVAVVGLGLIGSGTLRHLAAALVDTGTSVVGIGPAEPGNWSTHEGVFASHYDSGRVTRRLDARREWAVLASRSIDQYGLIEARSGLTFHHPVGMIYVRNDLEGLERQRAVAAELDIAIKDTLDTTPYRFPDGWTYLHEAGPAGHIDPRVMVEAQHRVAVADGAAIVRDEVQSVRRASPGFLITTASGVEVTAERVVVATGAYGNHLSAAPLALSVRPEAVILGEVDEETARSLTMPTAIWLLDHPDLDDIYVVPPVRYPDGRWYVKMGAANAHATSVADGDLAHRWMTSTDADDQLPVLRDVLVSILPSLDFLSFSIKPCLITDTASGLPFVGLVEDGLVVARAGNGHAAKSADAIGALAAGLALTGQWTDAELDESMFKPQFGVSAERIGSRHAT